MSEQKEERPANQDFDFDFSEESAREMMERLFDKTPFWERMRRMANGLGKPHDSLEYKFARLQAQRMIGPLMAFLLPLIFVLFLLTLKQEASVAKHTVAIEVVEPTEMEIEPEIPPPPTEMEFEPIDTEYNGPATEFTPLDVAQVSVSSDAFSPKPAEVNAVAIIKSPIIMRGIMGSRNPGARGQALRNYGGSKAGEAAVMRALRWLKSKQNSDGSWPGFKVAMTGLAVLTYLAHGETPRSDCVEFGPTVEKGIKYLTEAVRPDGLFARKNGNVDGNDYAQLIGAYALCEAYALTRVPKVKEAAERAISHVVNGQNPNGMWDYHMNPTSTRNDTSYSGWAAQAVKAAHMAGDLEVEGLDDCFKKAAVGFKVNAHSDGGFGYTERGRTGLSGIGALCMQLLGQSKSKEVRKTVDFLSECTCSFDEWDNQPYKGSAQAGWPLYYWYYITQVKFHAGGNTWSNWNKIFSPELQRQQQILKNAIADAEGKMRDVGWWDSPSKEESSNYGWGVGSLGTRVMHTCFCALQLMVYYRYLPTFKTPAAVDDDVLKSDTDEDEVGITVRRA